MDPSRQLLERETVRCMYPDELLSHLWDFKHSRYNTVGVSCNRWGRRVRTDVGIHKDFGTVYFATPRKREHLHVVPCDCLPYASIVDSEIDHERHQVTGDSIRGWRILLSTLCRDGYLFPNDELSFLIGEDTCQFWI